MVKKKVLFVLCFLLCYFFYVQRQFLKFGGLQVLRSLVQEKGIEVLVVCVVMLFYDLVIEKMFVEEEVELIQEMFLEKLQQYCQVYFLLGLWEQGWCEIMVCFLVLFEYDVCEKVLQILGVFLVICWDYYCQDFQFSRILVSLQVEYQVLVSLELQDGEDEGYFWELLGFVNSLLKELR